MTFTTLISHLQFNSLAEVYKLGKKGIPMTATLSQTGKTTSGYVVQNRLCSFLVDTDASAPEFTLNACNKEVRVSFRTFSLVFTWLEGPGEAKGEGHGPSCNEKCAINTISFANAPLTSALGHSKRYSEKRFETLKRTLCANQKRTFLLWRRRMHNASYLKQKMTQLRDCNQADINKF